MKPAFLSYGLKVKKKVLFYSTSLFYLFSAHLYFEQVQISIKEKGGSKHFAHLPAHLKEAELGPENELAFFIFSFSIHFLRVPLVC